MAVYLASYDHFEELNEICERHLTPPYPSRTTIVAGLRGMLVEIDAVLWIG
jgi:enamine deaminase RidA (YjgF/YER057c/UK114 family)